MIATRTALDLDGVRLSYLDAGQTEAAPQEDGPERIDRPFATFVQD